MKKIALILTTAALSMLSINAQANDAKRPDMSKLCQGKSLNTKVSQKMGDRTIEGTCQIVFKANNPNALERGAMRDPAIQNICKGKAKGSAVTAKVQGKNVVGKCDVVFKSNMKR